MGNVLVIDDDKNVCTAISNAVERMGHKTVHALTLKEGLEKACSDSFDVVFLDVQMPDGNGLDILPPIRGTPSSPEVIIITGFADPDGAELAIKNGAWDYIEKPCSVQEMTLPFIRALEYREEKKAAKVPVALKREGIVGSSPKLGACLDLLPQMSNSVANVLITGETGTGKELFARAIHENSPRAGKNFVVVDCAALPDTLVESVLFGHQKGAFTGADKAQDGLVKQADRGTLFLDEVGELPLSIQKSFLRVLQERRFRPVGGAGNHERFPVDLRHKPRHRKHGEARDVSRRLALPHPDPHAARSPFARAPRGYQGAGPLLHGQVVRSLWDRHQGRFARIHRGFDFV